jgi:hypothetical protein
VVTSTSWPAPATVSMAAEAVFDAAVDALVDDAKVLAVEVFARRCATAARRAAADVGVARQERLRRQRCISRWVDADTGMCITRIALDPLTDAEMWTAINAAVRATRATSTASGSRRRCGASSPPTSPSG